MAFSNRYCKPKYLMPALIRWLFEICLITATCNAQSTATVTVSIDGSTTIAKVDPNFICATLDWWPPEKCDYGTCSWGSSSLLNLDLTNQLFQNAVRGLSALLRLGGSLQDKLYYQVGNIQNPCLPFFTQSSLFGFSDGCLSMSRWDALNQFFQSTGAPIAFGLNALYGRETNSAQPWDSSNARDFIQYTADKGYQVIAWELGNELSGSGVGTSVPVSQYATDVKTLRGIVDEIYAGWNNKPLVVAPDGFLDWNWYQQLLQGTGKNVIDAITCHIYDLGSGANTDLVDEILNPSYLSQEESLFQSIKQLLQTSGPWAQGWVGEAGGAYNSGQHSVTDAFVFNFWYLDQLGKAAKNGIKVYCRQSLIGGNYGLLDHTTFQPNPNYFSALLWKKHMGTDVLSATVQGASYLRAYAHCSQGDAQSVTVVVLNLSQNTQYTVNLILSDANQGNVNLIASQSDAKASTNADGDHFQGKKNPDIKISTNTQRLEYHLTALNGDLHSQSVLLNGNLLQFTANYALPDLIAVTAAASDPLVVDPISVVFVKLVGVSTSACTQAAGA
ncbi:hypothetical protein O6H91_02G038500 [Diphasiastrum complanatum]|uniref:Uncharacterized protein n=1 Tax=Diphasiastrum complanatum TaxID=34168 RepID=A0ACC2EEM3_DIPCM|nr:hypothetical protein O6H91_02G038500 [Diphasiastrum complanatum]